GIPHFSRGPEILERDAKPLKFFPNLLESFDSRARARLVAVGVEHGPIHAVPGERPRQARVGGSHAAVLEKTFEFVSDQTNPVRLPTAKMLGQGRKGSYRAAGIRHACGIELLLTGGRSMFALII